MKIRWLPFVLLLVSPAAALEPIEFNRDIRPILSNNCFYCHGFDQANRKAGLRLDTFDGATEYAIVPGSPDESELLQRMLSDDPDVIMPPPDSEKQLSTREIELVREWIRQGAEYEEHWAWSELKRPPTTQLDKLAETSPIDAFLRQQWLVQGVAPVGVAAPREQLRRLSFDLRGLPPSYEEVQQFTQTPTQENFEAYRDRWMEEPAYAEHQAVQWLDLVRWADTSGFVSDEPIASGAYRAWVIRAIRDNVPFDQFSFDQLAGDLVVEPSEDQYIASGYNRIVNTNCEAGGIEAEQLYKLKGEHVRALGTVWLGMTTGCAECHDHKFDPLLAKDYYSLGAFFDDLVETGVYTPGDRREPLHYVYGDEARARLDAELRREIAQITERSCEKFESLEAPLRAEIERTLLEQLEPNERRDEFVWIAGQLPAARVIEGQFSNEHPDATTDSVASEVSAARGTFAGAGQLHRHHVAETMTGYLTGIRKAQRGTQDAWFVDVWLDETERPDMIGIQISNGRYGRLGWTTANYETYYWGEDSSGELSKQQPWSDPGRVKRLGDLPGRSGWVRLRVPHDELLPPVAGQDFEKVGMAYLHVGGAVTWGDSGLEVPHSRAASLRLAETTFRKWWSAPVNRQYFERREKYLQQALKKSSADRDALEQQLVLAAVREASQPELMRRLRDLESKLFQMRRESQPVLVSRQTDEPKQTRLLNRGDYQDASGPVLSAAVPEFLDKSGINSQTLTRLDLAKWLFSEAQHLVARVYVNRLWHQYYGRGLSETLEDSGTQGDWPSHIELLDWLACEFRDSGWDRKHMVKLVTSASAYRLSSAPSAELAERDPGNRWHARQGRYRLTSEQIRDAALEAAGLLATSAEPPVESFFPYQPDAYWSRSDKIMWGSRHMPWRTSKAKQQYSRTVYTFWKRQNVHPTLLAFDAPTRQECTARRNITNTPGQALALLNDPMFVEAARGLAQRACGDVKGNASASDGERIGAIFALSLQRFPSIPEQQVVQRLLDEQRQHFAAHPNQAEQLCSIGQSPLIDAANLPELAAWTIVARSVLNLHEFVTRP